MRCRDTMPEPQRLSLPELAPESIRVGFVLNERLRGSAFRCTSLHPAIRSGLPKSRRRLATAVPCNLGGAARGEPQKRSAPWQNLIAMIRRVVAARIFSMGRAAREVT